MEPNGLYVRLRLPVYPLLFLWRGGGGFAAFPPDFLACAQRMPPSIGEWPARDGDTPKYP